jgi:signal transduction histidine kinase
MLSHLRFRLTLLYLLVAVFLVGIVGTSSYSLINYYFTSSNDAALQYKMATTFAAIGISLPSELEESVLAWVGHQEKTEKNESQNKPGLESDEERKEALRSLENGLTYEGELSSIFLFPLDSKGQLVINPNPFSPPMNPDLSAAAAALKNGRDIRNSTFIDGSPVRLLSYAVPVESGFSVLQMGKPISDQQHLLNQFLIGLIVGGGLIVLLLGIGSWWMAGRYLQSTQRAWEMQQTFVANASHELRTPLTLIRASSEVVLRQSKPETKQLELVRDIMSECDHMSQLVDDLLLISKLDTHQLKLDLKPVLLSDLLTEIQRQFEPLAEKNGIRISLSDQPLVVIGDRLRLHQVILILLDNALRYTPAGGEIKISSDQSNRFARISIQDTGKGISSADLAHVFDRFYQAETDSSLENRGNGLGLSIAKSLVKEHNGHIHIASTPGQGTTVTFEIPISH